MAVGSAAAGLESPSGRRRRGRAGDADGAARRRGRGRGCSTRTRRCWCWEPCTCGCCSSPRRRAPPRPAALALVALALAPLALLIAFYARELGVGPGRDRLGRGAAARGRARRCRGDGAVEPCVRLRRGRRAARAGARRGAGDARDRRRHAAEDSRTAVLRRTGLARWNRVGSATIGEAMSEVLFTHARSAAAGRASRRLARAWRALSIVLIARGRARADRRRRDARVAGAVLGAVREIQAGPSERDVARGRTGGPHRRSSGGRWRACPTSAGGSRSSRASCSATRATAARWAGS